MSDDMQHDDTPLSVEEVERLANLLGHVALNDYVTGEGHLSVTTAPTGEGTHTFIVTIRAAFSVHPQATLLLDRYRRSARVELL